MNGKEFKKIRKDNGLNQKQIAEKLGVSASAVQSWEYERRNIPDTVIKLVHSVFLSSSESRSKDSKQMKKPELIENEDVHSDGKGIVPYYDNDITATIASSFNDVMEEPAYYVNYKPFNDCTAYVNCYGDSMFPKYKNGEKLAIKEVKDWNIIMWGEVYVVITDSEANDLKAIKEVHPHRDDDKIILRSSNPNYKGDTVINRKNILGLFIVKGKISQNFN